MNFIRLLMMTLGLGVVISVKGEEANFKTLDAHSRIFYALLEDYITTHSTDNPQNVVEFINSDATKSVFSDALRAGYPRPQLLFATYQYSFTTNPVRDVIVNALNDVIVQSNRVTDAQFYTTWTLLGSTACILIYIGRSIYTFRKYEKPVIEFISRSRDFVNSGRGPTTEPLIS